MFNYYKGKPGFDSNICRSGENCAGSDEIEGIGRLNEFSGEHLFLFVADCGCAINPMLVY